VLAYSVFSHLQNDSSDGPYVLVPNFYLGTNGSARFILLSTYAYSLPAPNLTIMSLNTTFKCGGAGLVSISPNLQQPESCVVPLSQNNPITNGTQYDYVVSFLANRQVRTFSGSTIAGHAPIVNCNNACISSSNTPRVAHQLLAKRPSLALQVKDEEDSSFLSLWIKNCLLSSHCR